MESLEKSDAIDPQSHSVVAKTANDFVVHRATTTRHFASMASYWSWGVGHDSESNSVVEIDLEWKAYFAKKKRASAWIASAVGYFDCLVTEYCFETTARLTACGYFGYD